VWEGWVAAEKDPSPKLQEYLLMVPSGSLEPAELNATGTPVDPR
jgi:hypothetical protein